MDIPQSLTACSWKTMVGRLLCYWGWLIFRGYVKLPGSIPENDGPWKRWLWHWQRLPTVDFLIFYAIWTLFNMAMTTLSRVRPTKWPSTMARRRCRPPASFFALQDHWVYQAFWGVYIFFLGFLAMAASLSDWQSRPMYVLGASPSPVPRSTTGRL